MKVLSAFIFALIVLPGCGGGSSPSDPGGGGDGNGNGDVVLISGENQADWNVTLSNDASWQSGTFRIYVTPYGSQCSANSGSCTATSAERIDFTQYSSARLKFHAKWDSVDFGSDGSMRVRVNIISNVPGQDNLQVYSGGVINTDGSFDDDLDINLQNVLSLSEATIKLYCSASTGVFDGNCLDKALIEVSNFRIIGTK